MNDLIMRLEGFYSTFELNWFLCCELFTDPSHTDENGRMETTGTLFRNLEPIWWKECRHSIRQTKRNSLRSFPLNLIKKQYTLARASQHHQHAWPLRLSDLSWDDTLYNRISTQLGLTFRWNPSTFTSGSACTIPQKGWKVSGAFPQ